MATFKNLNVKSCILGLFLPALAVADPVISDVEGDIFVDGKMAILGSNFGDFGGRIIAWDDFEGHPAGTYVNRMDSVKGDGWTTQYGYTGSAIAVNSQRSVSGNRSVKVEWGADGGHTIRAFGWGGKGPIEKIYISYQRYMQGNYSASDRNNHKQFYLFGNNSDFPQFMPLIPGGEVTWAIYNNSGSASSRLSGERAYNELGLTYNNTNEKFQRWEWYLELNVPYDKYNGVVKGWVDGQKGWDISDYRHAYGSGQFNDFRLGHMAQGFVGSAVAWFDDVYTATTPARAEICYSDQWVNCGREKTLLVPEPQSWTNGKIFVSLSGVDFDSTRSLYLYVVDSDGNANSKGYVLDGSSPSSPSSPSITENPPNPPSGIIAD